MSRILRATTLAALLASSAVVASACTSSGSTPAPSTTSSPVAIVPPSIGGAVVPPPSANATDTPAPSDSGEPGANASTLPSAVPTDIDPCQVITADEAGQLAGATFAAGKEEETSGHARICTYGSNTPNVFMVIVAIAPDVATAKAAEAAAEQDLKDNAQSFGVPFHVKKLPNFADQTDAVILDGSASLGGQSISGRGIYLLRGTTFVGFNDLVRGKPAPSEDDMTTEATTVLGRVP